MYGYDTEIPLDINIASQHNSDHLLDFGGIVQLIAFQVWTEDLDTHIAMLL